MADVAGTAVNLVTATSATDVTSSTDTAVTRLETLGTVTVTDPTTANITVGTTDVVTPAYVATGTVTPSNASKSVIQSGTSQPMGYQFNLPPHDWSLPVRPGTVDPDLVGQTNDDSFHGLRRGRLWFWAGVSDVTKTTSSSTGSSTSSGSGQNNFLGAPIDNAYGFQFLWNPTSISTSVSRNMDITPSSADTLRVVAGVFPGQETVSLNIMLDRTNDFACIKAASNQLKLYPPVNGASTSPNLDPTLIDLSTFAGYYNAIYPGAATSDMTTQINKLMAQGTMADLEYLFMAINGSGNGSLQWTNLLGKKTANIGYLAPTLLGVQLGPTLDNLSYVGWVTNLGINHTSFTEDMIPIRTQVSISIECFSGSGISGA
jgi:hypothetical protein